MIVCAAAAAWCAIVAGVCGRYTSATPIGELAACFEVGEVRVDGEAVPPSWNVAPTRHVLAVTTSRDGTTRRLEGMRWGLVPSWAKDPKVGGRFINARAETLAASNVFKRPFATRRCLLPADGYYEWLAQPAAGGQRAAKRPFYYSAPDGQPLAIGGLWTVWHDAEQTPLTTCTIITTAPNRLAAQVHDRMPLLVPPERWGRWLAPEPLDPLAAAEVLVAAADDAIEAREVSPAVNNVRNDAPALIDPAPLP